MFKYVNLMRLMRALYNVIGLTCRRFIFGACLLFILAWPINLALGVERFPPPEFESGYKLPGTTTPAPRAEILEYLDVAVLLGALSLTAYFVLKQRSRRAILGLMIFSILYFGFYRQGCVCSIGSIQDVTLALFDSSYAAPLTVIAFFLLPLVFALFFGRVFCAAVCPHGAAQDLMCVHPVKIHPTLEHALGLIPFLYLALAVLFAATGSAFILCEYDPFIAFFRRSGSFNMLALGAGFLVVGIFIGRPYCRFLCPYGALLRVISYFAKWFVTLTPEDCMRCQICDVACPYGAIKEPTEATPAAVPVSSWPRWVRICIMLPLLAIASGWLGSQLAVPLSRMHVTVRLAERIAAEDSGKTGDFVEKNQIANQLTTQATLGFREANLRLSSKAFRMAGKAAPDLIGEALQLRRQFKLGGWIVGVFVGLVVGLKLAFLSLPQARAAFEPDRSGCVACGRCFSYCPNDLLRLKKLQRKKVLPVSPAAS